MKAVILVGGQGTRLRPLTEKFPKPMLPVANVPFFEHTLRYLKSHSVTDITLSSGYLGQQFEDYFKDGQHIGVDLKYAREDKPLGTCGAVKNAEQFISGETTVVLNGDILCSVNLKQLLDFHRSKKAKVTITLYAVEDPTAYGLVSLNSDNRVEDFLEKPSFDQITTHWINAGIYIIEPEVLKNVPKDIAYSFERELFPNLLKNNEPVYGFPFSGYWKDIGKPNSYLKAHHDILEGRLNSTFKGEEIKPRVFVGKNTKISEKATIFGPTVIGDNCTIEDDAMIFSNTTIGNNCHIAKSAKIYESVIYDNVSIGEDNIIKSSIIANEVKLGNEVHIDNLSILGEKVAIGHRNMLSKGIKLYPKTTIEKDQIRF